MNVYLRMIFNSYPFCCKEEREYDYEFACFSASAVQVGLQQGKTVIVVKVGFVSVLLKRLLD